MELPMADSVPSAAPLRIAAFGFRSYPPREGSAGADKFAMELLPRLAALGHQVTAYNRVYPGMTEMSEDEVEGVRIKSFRTVSKAGFDTLWHSLRATIDIVARDTADVVHIQNGGNSIFALFLRLFCKKTFLSQDGFDWQRDKWPWYAKVYLWLSTYLTARVHNAVIFDNIYARQEFEKRFKQKYDFIPFGADVKYNPAAEAVIDRLGLTKKNYFLFVGRFIPDKGLHWLVPAFEGVETDKVLVLVGGSPNPSEYDENLRKTTDPRIKFTGFLYGEEVHALMRNAYAYIQPSAVEGLSPVILEASYLGAPVLCSDIPQNTYGLGDHGVYFRTGDVEDIRAKLRWALDEQDDLSTTGAAATRRITEQFSWDSVVNQHVDIFRRVGGAGLA